MNVTSVQNCNNLNVKRNFNGSVDKSVYKMVRNAKRGIVSECYRDERKVPVSQILIKMVNETLCELNEFVKNLHPDTKVIFRSVIEPDTGEKFILLQAKNSKVGKTLNLRRINKSACTSYFDEMAMIRAELDDVVKKVNPEDVDYTLFSKAEKAFVSTTKKPSYNAIDKFFLRYKAKKLDKLAPEFHANQNVLHRLDARIKIIDRVNRR